MTKLQKVGIAILVLSVLGGGLGAELSIYLSLANLDAAENSGIGRVGDQITYAILFTAGGIVGSLVGLVLFVVGRSRT